MSSDRVYRVYEPITGVSMLSAAGRCTGTLQVTAMPGRASPIGLSLPDDSLVSLSIAQLDELVERLGRARADAVAAAAFGGADVARA